MIAYQIDKVLFSIIAIVFILGIPENAQSYTIRYDYYVYATQSDGIPITDDGILSNGPTSLYGNYTKTGSDVVGNYATVDFSANLATGSIGSYAYSYGERIGNTGYTATGQADISMQDTLYFLVPAGTYDDGVSVSLSGRVDGFLSSTFHAGSQVEYSVSFGSQGINPPLVTIGIGESGSIPVSDSFELAELLVPAGGTLLTPQIFDVRLDAGLYNNITWTTSIDPGDYSASAIVDFGNTMQFTSLNTPGFVTWSSDSGVFLSQVVPIPGAIWLFGSGLIAFIGFIRKR